MPLSDGAIRVLLGVIETDECFGNVTYPDLLTYTQLSRTTIHKHLHRLRDRGLVTFEDGKKGTIRPLVRTVAVG